MIRPLARREADYITVWDEVIEEGQPLELFDPDATWKRRTYTDYTIKPLQEKIFDHGELVYQQPRCRRFRSTAGSRSIPCGTR